MSGTQQIASRLSEVLLDGYWVANTNFKDQISKVNHQQATRKIGNLNTIAMLTYHINYYLAGLLEVFAGGPLRIRDQYSFNLPPIRTDEDWQLLVNEFIANAEKFVKAVEKMPEEKLEEIFVEEKYGNYSRNLNSVIEHAYYHLGQISLLRKVMETNI